MLLLNYITKNEDYLCIMASSAFSNMLKTLFQYLCKTVVGLKSAPYIRKNTPDQPTLVLIQSSVT